MTLSASVGMFSSLKDKAVHSLFMEATTATILFIIVKMSGIYPKYLPDTRYRAYFGKYGG